MKCFCSGLQVGTREWLASRVMAWAGGRTDGATDGAADAENGEGFESRLFLLLSLPGERSKRGVVIAWLPPLRACTC